MDNEYTNRILDSDNGLFYALGELKNGRTQSYLKYFSKITNGKTCPDEHLKFWFNYLTKSDSSPQFKQILYSHPKPKLMLNSGASPWLSMNVDHSKLIQGDLFLYDGNHRVLSELLIGNSPVVDFDDINLSEIPNWKGIIDAKLNPTHRVKHQPHPHPILDDLTPYRSMESCKARYLAIKEAGIRSVYEIGCAEGVGLWLLNKAGVETKGSEIFAPSRHLAESLLKHPIDGMAQPNTIPNSQCLIIYSVLYHLLSNQAECESWINRIKQFPCVAIELSTEAENTTKPHYLHMSKYDPLSWWPNKKHIYTDPNHANRETYLCWK